MSSEVETVLLKYLEERYNMNNPLVLADIQAILAMAQGKMLPWKLRSEDGFPCLHIAVMNEATLPQELYSVITTLLMAGAPPTMTDEDGDTALKAVMVLSEDSERPGEGEEQTKEELDALKMLHVSVVRALLHCPLQPVCESEVCSVVSWLRHYIPEEFHPMVISDLQKRVGEEIVAQAKSSEDLLAYLEEQAYDNETGVDSSKVEALIAKGARPEHKQRGASALLLAVLNPYSTLEELERVFRMMLTKAPAVTAIRDGFKLSALQWAADYRNVASQSQLSIPNPAALLALMPLLVELVPEDIDSGAQCLKVSPDGQCCVEPPRGAPSLRFMEGDRVVCLVMNPGGEMEWEEGVVIGRWYREACWPRQGHPGAPYEVKLDIGTRYFSLVDNDRLIRPEPIKQKKPKPAAPAASGSWGFAVAGPGPGAGSGGYPQAKASPKAAAGGAKRFQKRQCPDGSWELLDTVSGKARPCPPPDSDSD